MVARAESARAVRRHRASRRRHARAGLHRVVASYFARGPAAPGWSGARLRKSLMASHPYLVALETDGEPAARIARFMEREEVVDSGPLLLHSRPTNAEASRGFS